MKKHIKYDTAIIAMSDAKKQCALVRLFRKTQLAFYKHFAKTESEAKNFTTYTFTAFVR